MSMSLLHVTRLCLITCSGNVIENTANEFFLGFARNYEGAATLSLFITTTELNPVDFTVETTGFNYSGVAQRNSSTTVTLPSEIMVESSSERNKGVRVKAVGDQKLVVYGLSYQLYTTDAFLALPCNRLAVDNYEYYSIMYHDDPGGLSSHLLLVGCEDDTTVTLPGGTVTLQKQETYLLDSSVDLTGTKVVSDKPMSVFPGHQCTSVPNPCCCDYLVEQVPPTAIWGETFLVASFVGRNSGELLRFLTSADSTTVTITRNTLSEPFYRSLSTAGSWDEVMISAGSFCSIESDQPILLMEFALSFDFDSIGDPFMVMITPVEQYSNNYVIDLLPEFTTNYITIYIGSEYFQPELIFVDDMNLQSTNWTSVSCLDNETCGYIAYVELQAGEHSLYHSGNTNAKLGVTAYGFFEYDSYGYPGGLQLVPVQCKSTPLFYLYISV